MSSAMERRRMLRREEEVELSALKCLEYQTLDSKRMVVEFQGLR